MSWKLTRGALVTERRVANLSSNHLASISGFKSNEFEYGPIFRVTVTLLSHTVFNLGMAIVRWSGEV